jgi:hypothetical protein
VGRLHLYAAWGLAALSLSVTAWSLRTPVRLESEAGFDEAMARLGGDAFVVLWPPGQSAALARLPATVRAADVVPRDVARLVVLGPAGFDTPPELLGATAGERQRAGDLELAPYTFPRADRVLYDLRASLPRARVLLHGPSGDVPCDAAQAAGWSCPGRPEWNRVTAERLRVLGDDWPSVWAHPVAGLDLVIDAGKVRLGDRLEVEAALADGAAGMRGGAAVQLDLEIDGVVRQTLWRSNQPGVARLDVPTTRGTEGDVRLVIKTTHDGRRHLGVNLRALETP